MRLIRITLFVVLAGRFLMPGSALAQFIQLNPIDPTWSQPTIFLLGGGAVLPSSACDPDIGGGICVSARGDTVEAIYTETVQGHIAGEVVWVFSIPNGFAVAGISQPVVDGFQGGHFVFVSAADDTLYKINLLDGSIPNFLGLGLGQCDTLDAPPVVQYYARSNAEFQMAMDNSGHRGSDLVIIPTSKRCLNDASNKVLAFDTNLQPVWAFNRNFTSELGAGLSACSVDYGRNVVYCGFSVEINSDLEPSVLAIHTINGTKNWSAVRSVPGPVWTTPTLSRDGLRLYVENQDPLIYALDPEGDGLGHAKLLWSAPVQLPAPVPFPFQAGEIVVDTRPEDPPWLFVVDGTGTLNRLTDQGNTGHIDWSKLPDYTNECGNNFLTAPVFVRGTGSLYVGTDSAQVAELFDPVKPKFNFKCSTISNFNGFNSAVQLTLDKSHAGGAPDRLFGTSLVAANRFAIPWHSYRFVSDISLALTGPTQINWKDTFTYLLTVTNNGPNWATDVMLTDTRPTSIKVTSVLPSRGFYDAKLGRAEFGDMPPNSTATLAVNVHQVGFAPSITYSALAVAGEFDPKTANNAASLTTKVIRPAAVSFSSNLLLFGNQLIGTTSAPQNVNLTNIGDLPLSMSSILSDISAYVEGNNCPIGGSLAGGGSCAISVKFKPSTAGLAAGKILFADNGFGSPQSVTLIGTGIERPSLSGQIVSQQKGPAVLFLLVKLSNVGAGDAASVMLNQVPVRTLGGSGTVTYVGPQLPISIGNLAAGANAEVTLQFLVPNTVTKFVISEKGTMQDIAADSLTFTAAQVVYP